ncbi:unnamed protein product [Amaranthus hypochondriacus]
MAFFSKVGNVLKQSVSKQLTSQFSASNPSIYQAIRCMSSSKVFVGGLSYSVDDTSLRDTFARYGEVVEARVIVDREQNRSRGFGFVTFSSTEEASSAIQALDGQDLQGRRVRVNYATERAPRQGGFGGYGGGGYGGQNYGGGGYGGQNYGGGGGYGGQNYGGGGYGGQNYGGGGGNYGRQNYGGDGGYGGQNYGGNTGDGYAPSTQNTDVGNYGVAGGVGGRESHFGGGAAGGNVTAETGFASSGLENGSADQFGSKSNSGLGDDIDFESKGPLEENFKDDDEPNDFAKRA